MTDALGLRAVFSVLLPATNAMVEPDMAALRPAGVTNQTYRFPFPGLPETVEGLMDLMRATLDLALACEPDRIVVGYTPEHMADGVIAASRLRTCVEDTTGLPATMASDAVSEALKVLGAQRIGSRRSGVRPIGRPPGSSTRPSRSSRRPRAPQPFPMLARLAPETGAMRLKTSVLLLPILNAVEAGYFNLCVPPTTSGA